MAQIVKIKSIEHLTHDVLKIVADRPVNLSYLPGQAVDVAINKPGWEKEWRSFTFTSLPDDDHIEFNIKTYPSHNGVTNQLLSLSSGDELVIGDVYGDIKYKGEGIFIAGGAGITPFIAILKHLEKNNQLGNNKLIFANKTKGDIIQEEKLGKLLGKNFINVLSDEQFPGYEHGFISPDTIKKHMDGNMKYFYLCGPPPMMDAVGKHLASLGVSEEAIVKEGF
ncbi:MAG: flavodoxin reductase [Chitinophagaceae bacterium]|nr:flavodoxin reductase [Bacteroidota bacterium]MCC6256742.1 flavodoxin reductase [Chitinophagaceae bacterium]MCW5915779.1 flavodoxin reductase [Ferruginibacter sp.]